MEKSLCWQNLFQRWPDSIPKLGIVVTSLNEGITFSSFQVSDSAVLLERDRPDTMGAVAFEKHRVIGDLKVAERDPLIERYHDDPLLGDRIGPALKKILPADAFFHGRHSVAALKPILGKRKSNKKPGAPEGVRASNENDPEGI